MNIPQIPLAEWIDAGQKYLTDHYAEITRAIAHGIQSGITTFSGWLYVIPPWVFIIAVALICWRVAGKKLAIGSILGLCFIWNIDLWWPLLDSITLVVFATLISMLIALPLGILAALSERAYSIIMPILDFMQTMPAFVYLIPAIPFFGIGIVSAIFATVIFSMPPAIRFTALGIRQVPKELTEAADAFGTTRTQQLVKLQLPLALPTIMAGVNQTIMLALSMVVIAAMIGANGLGQEVWAAIQTNAVGKGFESGIAVVILAMLLDRITQAIKSDSKKSS